MLEDGVMEPAKSQSWIPDDGEQERDGVVLTSAELAECTCPDPCECDHDVD